MEFKEILEKYENDIKHVNRMLNPDCLSFFKKSVEYWKGYKKACYNWFQQMKECCEDFNPKSRKPSKEEKDKFTYISESGCKYEVVAILEYRNEIIPIYCDDYGQQNFIVFKGEEYCGGAYNICSERDFCAFVDCIKDEIE